MGPVGKLPSARCALAVKLSEQPTNVHAFGAESLLLQAAPPRTPGSPR